MKTFETNASGSNVALVTARIESLVGTIAAIINPSAENAATPRMNETMAATSVRSMIYTSKKATPAPSMMAMARSAIQVAETTRPERYT